MGITGESTEDNSLNIQIRIAEIDAEFAKMFSSVSANTVDAFDENKVQDLMREKTNLQQQLARIADTKQKKENAKSRLEEIYTIIDGLKKHPLTYDDQLVRKLIECINGAMNLLVIILATTTLSPSLIYPVLSIGSLMVVTVFSAFIFKEKMCWWQWIGVGVGAVAIILLSV